MIHQSLLEEQYKKAAPKKPPVRAKVRASELLLPFGRVLHVGENLNDTNVQGVLADSENLSELGVSKCRIADCAFHQCDLCGSVFEDVVFANCDFSNAIIESVGFRRCEFLNCKFTGASFAESAFENVTLKDCNASFASFIRVRWKNVSAATCDFTKSDMGEMELAQVALIDCRLTGVNFFKTNLTGIDLTTCQIEGIVVSDSMSEVRGAKMDTYQAAIFVRKLGILIAE